MPGVGIWKKKKPAKEIDIGYDVLSKDEFKPLIGHWFTFRGMSHIAVCSDTTWRADRDLIDNRNKQLLGLVLDEKRHFVKVLLNQGKREVGWVKKNYILHLLRPKEKDSKSRKDALIERVAEHLTKLSAADAQPLSIPETKELLLACLSELKYTDLPDQTGSSK